jgi:CDP-diacylglycerol---glycerol-3-phosphate 3-phosphatidyltransferase
MNIPNQITLGRLVLTIVFFAILTRYSAAREPADTYLLAIGFWLYLLAALTDIVDGYLARTWQQVTAFGRVVDPVVDKIMVCGAFVFFASTHFYSPTLNQNITGVEPWMVVLILVRELLVSAIRSFSEAQGRDFAANWVGKAKSFVQFATACVVLGVLAWYRDSLAWLRVACVWITVGVTALSVVAYLFRARNLVLSPEALGRVRSKPTAATTPAADGVAA